MGGDLSASVNGVHMTNLAITLAIFSVIGAVFFACDRLIKGDYPYRPVLVVAFNIVGLWLALLVLFSAQLGIASALGLFTSSIDRTVDLDFMPLFGREKNVALTCFLAGVFELIAAWVWWDRRSK